MSANPIAITSARYTLIEVGAGFLIQDRQHPNLFIKIEQWEIQPPSQQFREYAHRILDLLNDRVAGQTIQTFAQPIDLSAI